MRPLFSYSFVFVALVFGVLAAPRTSHLTPKLKESVPPPRKWIDLGRAPPAQPIPLRIALPQTRFDELERHLYETSDPSHSRYGQHLLKEQVEELVKPHSHSVNSVEAWLAQYGITAEMLKRSPAGDWITVNVPVMLAEEMLDTEFRVWKHAVDGDVLIRTTQYSLPEHLHEHVDLIQPTTYFGRSKAMSTTNRFSGVGVNLPGLINVTVSVGPPGGPTGTPNVNCSEYITISCLLQLYNANSYTPAATNKNSIGITGYLGQFANQADLQRFYQVERPDAVGSTFKTVLVNNGQNSQDISLVGPEANLDTQFAFGLTYPTPATFYSTGGSPPFNPDITTPTNTNEPYLDWLEFMKNLPNSQVPPTISTSYGDNEQTVPSSYALRVCQEFAALSSRGVSLIFSSGDGGAGDDDPDASTQECFSNDGKNRTEFLPTFPATCPYVTSVGGTIGIPEVGAFFSGGGFSNYFARPDYQNAAVNNYLKTLPPGQYSGLYNPQGRAYPDVSAQSWNFVFVYQNQTYLIGGTSASAPTFAGIVTLLNDVQLAAGKPPLGFLNPFLYSKGVNGLNDITTGNAPGCGTQGFSAAPGWDPVTGLGTPDFGKLKDILTLTILPPPTTLGGILSLADVLLGIGVTIKLLLSR